MQPDDDVLINEDAAHKFAQSIADSTTRNLVVFGIAEARMRAIQRAGQDEAEWRASLPKKPFDMAFFAKV